MKFATRIAALVSGFLALTVACGSGSNNAGYFSAGGSAAGGSAAGGSAAGGHTASMADAMADASDDDAGSAHWVGTWCNAPLRMQSSDLPPAPGLSGNALRQIAYVSIGGRQLRVRFSNAFGDGPVTLASAHVANSGAGGAINPASDTILTFSGSPSVTIVTGDTAFSDPVLFPLLPLANVAVTVVFGGTPAAITGHPLSLTTSYLQAGGSANATDFGGAVTTPRWYYLTGIDVLAESTSGAVVILGDSLTDGTGATIDGNDRWPDVLSRRLRANGPTATVAVLNEAIGGNSIFSGSMGPTAEQRVPGDVLGQSGARWLIVFEGVNDIGGSADASVVDHLITDYGQFIDLAHSRGLRVYGVPILPFGGSTYSSAAHESARQAVNMWIRASGRFDTVIDFDAVVRDPANQANLLPAYDSGDHLHLSPVGYQAIADDIDLSLFVQ